MHAPGADAGAARVAPWYRDAIAAHAAVVLPRDESEWVEVRKEQDIEGNTRAFIVEWDGVYREQKDPLKEGRARFSANGPGS